MLQRTTPADTPRESSDQEGATFSKLNAVARQKIGESRIESGRFEPLMFEMTKTKGLVTSGAVRVEGSEIPGEPRPRL